MSSGVSVGLLGLGLGFVAGSCFELVVVGIGVRMG